MNNFAQGLLLGGMQICDLWVTSPRPYHYYATEPHTQRQQL